MRAIEHFHSLCSQVRDPSIRMALEAWAARHIRSYSVTAHVDRHATASDSLVAFEQRSSLEQMIRGVVKDSEIYETSPWMQGDQNFGTLIRRTVSILAEESK